ncbi:MAG: hypothetical protein FD123_3081 [Bacteroidetes bacterium]|nr:MAG: hypothetical protein FD123_3081 [Bacteroidota bacterium]
MKDRSKFWRRFRLFLFGFTISFLACYFTLWKGRGDALSGWFPNERVLKFLTRSTMSVQDRPKCVMDCYEITLTDVRNGLKEGDVDFGNSNTSKEPCHEYQVKIKDKAGKPLEVRFAACLKDSTSQLIAVFPEGQKTCDCK